MRYYEKARELGELILASEESRDLADAAAALENAGNPEDKKYALLCVREAENALNELFRQIVGIISMTVWGDTPVGCGASGLCKERLRGDGP